MRGLPIQVESGVLDASCCQALDGHTSLLPVSCNRHKLSRKHLLLQCTLVCHPYIRLESFQPKRQHIRLSPSHTTMESKTNSASVPFLSTGEWNNDSRSSSDDYEPTQNTRKSQFCSSRAWMPHSYLLAGMLTIVLFGLGFLAGHSVPQTPSARTSNGELGMQLTSNSNSCLISAQMTSFQSLSKKNASTLHPLLMHPMQHGLL